MMIVGDISGTYICPFVCQFVDLISLDFDVFVDPRQGYLIIFVQVFELLCRFPDQLGVCIGL